MYMTSQDRLSHDHRADQQKSFVPVASFPNLSLFQLHYSFNDQRGKVIHAIQQLESPA
jgi:hypothetical protein